jgi:dTMP kinase
MNETDDYAQLEKKHLRDWGKRGKNMPIMIAFEGIDGSGKNTQSKLLAQSLRKMGHKVWLQDFPRYDSTVGAWIKKALTEKEHELTDAALHLLMEVDRVDFIHDSSPFDDLDFIVFDRWTLSNLAFMRAKELDTTLCEQVQTFLPKANITFFLDIPSGESFLRRPDRRDKHETNSELLFNTRKHYKYLMDELIASDELAVSIGGTQDVEDIHNEVMAHVKLAFLTPELVDHVPEDSLEVSLDGK